MNIPSTYFLGQTISFTNLYKGFKVTLEFSNISGKTQGKLREFFVLTSVRTLYNISVDSRFAPSQWEMALLCNDGSHWLGTSPVICNGWAGATSDCGILHHVILSDVHIISMGCHIRLSHAAVNTLRMRKKIADILQMTHRNAILWIGIEVFIFHCNVIKICFDDLNDSQHWFSIVF